MTETPPSSFPGGGTDTNPPGMTDELRALRRSQSNRVIAGVLGGLGRQLGIDPLILRIITAVLALFGGVGIMLYALAWLLIPDDGETASVLDQAIGRRDVRDAAAVPLALALGAVFVISFGFIIGSSWNSWILLILVGMALFTLIRRHGDATGSEEYPPTPPYDPMTAAYEPASAGTDAPEDTAPGSAAGTPHAEQASTQTGTTPSSDAFPGAAPAGSTPPPDDVGTGWPEGPDWGVPQRESPYDDLYVRTRETEPAPAAPQPRQRSVLGRLTFSCALLAVGILALADGLWGAEPGPLYIALPLAIVGAGLLLGSWFGRSRGLIVLGILLTIALVPATAVTNWDLASGTYTVPPPTSVAELPTQPLRHGAGPMHYDMSNVELTDDDDVSVTMQLGVGELTVIVPQNADVTVNTSVGAGEMELFDESSDGLGQERTVTDLGPDGPGGGTIELNIELGAGNVDVTRDDSEGVR